MVFVCYWLECLPLHNWFWDSICFFEYIAVCFVFHLEETTPFLFYWSFISSSLNSFLTFIIYSLLLHLGVIYSWFLYEHLHYFCFMYMNIFVCMHICAPWAFSVCRGQNWVPESSGSAVTDCANCQVGAGNQIWIIYKSRQCSQLLSHLSSPSCVFHRSGSR